MQNTISQFIQQQFPEFYNDEGQVFIAFIEEYYKWMESEWPIPTRSYDVSMKNGAFAVTSSSNSISTSDDLTAEYANGEYIAIYKEDSVYDLHTISSVNTSVITLESNVEFSSTTAYLSPTKLQKNPHYYILNHDQNNDVDTAVDEFIIFFKEKYLKNIKFDTTVDIRLLIKHALDFYRSKGTERGADLLFRTVFGVDVKYYYPGDDIFRLSDGDWHVPRYLELSLKESNAMIGGTQIIGVVSGATAFVESVIRKTVKGRLIDVAFISAKTGDFVTGEPLNYANNGLSVDDQPFITGSLTSLEFPPLVDLAGESFAVGDLVGLTSSTGEGGKGRVAGVANVQGVITITLDKGGYGFSNTFSEVLISNTVLSVNNMVIPANTVGNEYFSIGAKVYQPYANLVISGNAAAITLGINVNSYHANNLVDGLGKVLVVDGANVQVSVISGNLNYGTLYTAANADTLTIDTYTDKTVSANAIGYASNSTLYVSNVTASYSNGEMIYQVNSITSAVIATANVIFQTNTGAGTAAIRVSNVDGIFRSTYPITGDLSGNETICDTLSFVIGVKDESSNGLISANDNFIYVQNTSITGDVTKVGAGSGFTVGIDPTRFAEDVSVFNDVMVPYLDFPMYDVKTGTVAITSGSNVVTGTGTSFVSEINVGAITGTMSVNISSNVITGNSTVFTTELSALDTILIGPDYCQITNVVNSSVLYTNAVSGFTSTASGLTANLTQHITIDNGVSNNQFFITSITNSTSLVTNVNASATMSGANLIITGLFPNNALYYNAGEIDEGFDTIDMRVGKIRALINLSKGANYDLAPIVVPYDSYIRSFAYQDWVISYEGASASFAIGELITQEATDARGLIKSSNATHIIAERLRLLDSNLFITTSNSTTIISGQTSGSTANLVSVTTEEGSKYLGQNARLLTSSATGNGSITDVDVIQSGFGYKDGQEVSLTGDFDDITMIARLGKSGKGEGYYKRRGGETSSDKKIHDGFYYQDYSYEIRSSVQLNKYTNMLKQLIHVAGTQSFGAFVYNTTANVNIDATYSSVSQE